MKWEQVLRKEMQNASRSEIVGFVFTTGVFCSSHGKLRASNLYFSAVGWMNVVCNAKETHMSYAAPF